MGHRRSQHLDVVEMRAEMDGMASSFAMGVQHGLDDARLAREREAFACIVAMSDSERDEFFASLRLEFCIHCARRRRGETCHCTNDE